jgi:motility quorum-sensing regulator/GCU-specific mRNA interferase toxin
MQIRGKANASLQAVVVKTLAEVGKIRVTEVAVQGGAALGFDVAGIIGVVKALTTADFYKSMTTYADHRVWHDVYRPVTRMGDVYLKLTVIDDVLVVSFKEL